MQNGKNREHIAFNRVPLDSDNTKQNNQSTWINFLKKVRIISPFLWPRKDVMLQFRIFLCFLLIAGARVVNLYIPIYNKLLTNSMTGPEKRFRWDYVLTYITLKYLQGGGPGGMGVLSNLRSVLWIKVQQYTTREIEVNLFSHLHSLSLRWHLTRKTGEVLRVMDRGTESINSLLRVMLFAILPTIVDIIIAIVYFASAFNAWFGLIVFSTMFFFIITTITLTEWRKKFQRCMNLADNEYRARSVDSLLNFETVKYYGAEKYEVSSFKEAIQVLQSAEWKAQMSIKILVAIQNTILCGGILCGIILCIHFVVDQETLTVGDYILFSSYLMQLNGPINWLGTYYRNIQKNFVDMENMFDLLHEKQEIVDASDATIVTAVNGKLEFQNVSYGYTPGKLVLEDVSFCVQPGKTIALVGPTGSGKSTVIKLLFRFYDVNSGSVLIDGKDVKAITQESLRQAIGVVPQDTVLFNNTIKFNIKYGRLDAPDSDVVAAARGAEIHEKILTFPETYDTQVGERGLRLSGGEKQRVAIARTILKSPEIVLLDEATSALDTQTERKIQESLNNMCSNKTTVIVAHRLSTIIHADEILVLKGGKIVERGKHEYLVEEGGVYAQMWRQQLENKEAVAND